VRISDHPAVVVGMRIIGERIHLAEARICGGSAQSANRTG